MFVRYRCNGVCKADRTVDVPDLARAVDLVFWIEKVVMPRVAVDHAKFTGSGIAGEKGSRMRVINKCDGSKVDLLLPVPEGSTHIGQKVENEAELKEDAQSVDMSPSAALWIKESDTEH